MATDAELEELAKLVDARADSMLKQAETFRQEMHGKIQAVKDDESTKFIKRVGNRLDRIDERLDALETKEEGSNG